MKNKINSIIVNLTGYSNKIQPSDKLEEGIGFDSLDRVELIMNIEKEFNIEVSDDEFETLKRVRDIYNLVRYKTNNRDPFARIIKTKDGGQILLTLEYGGKKLENNVKVTTRFNQGIISMVLEYDTEAKMVSTFKGFSKEDAEECRSTLLKMIES